MLVLGLSHLCHVIIKKIGRKIVGAKRIVFNASLIILRLAIGIVLTLIWHDRQRQILVGLVQVAESIHAALIHVDVADRRVILHGVVARRALTSVGIINASAGSEPFVPCYNKKNWEEDSWCQEDCIQRILDNPETCDWHCVDPDMARQTTTNTGWACTSGGKYSRCTNSCGCRGSPGDSTWCCGAESTDVCWDNKCYASCAITLPPSEPSARPTLKPTTKQPTSYPTKYPTPYPTHFPSRSPTPYPTLPTFHPTHPHSHNYILLRRNSACVGDEKNLGLVTLDQCGEGCQNITRLFIFGKVGGSKCDDTTCICRCELDMV